MKSLSEIETTAKRASKAAGFSWGEAEEIGKCIRQLEMFGLPGIKHLNSYFNDKKKNQTNKVKVINTTNKGLNVRPENCDMDFEIKKKSLRHYLFQKDHCQMLLVTKTIF